MRDHDMGELVRQLEDIADLIERLEMEKIEREYKVATLTRITAIIVAVSAFGAVCVHGVWAHWGAM